MSPDKDQKRGFWSCFQSPIRIYFGSCYSVPYPQTQIYTITMAVIVYTIRMAVGAARVRFSRPLQTLYNFSWGPGFETSSTTSAFTLVPQHDTNMEAEWNELANNKAWVSEVQLAESTQITVYSLSPSLQMQKSVHSLALTRQYWTDTSDEIELRPTLFVRFSQSINEVRGWCKSRTDRSSSS